MSEGLLAKLQAWLDENPDSSELSLSRAEVVKLVKAMRCGDEASDGITVLEEWAPISNAALDAGLARIRDHPFDEASEGGICHMGHDWQPGISAKTKVCLRCGEVRRA